MIPATNTKLVKRVLYHMTEHPAPNIIAVFTLNSCDIDSITASIVDSLPEHYESTVAIHLIDESESVLKGLHSRGTKTYRIVYNENVFRYITPEQFLRTHYRWLYKQTNFLYSQYPDIHDMLSEDDAFQECSLYLDRILCKFTEQCNLRTFVYNRLRRYFSRIVERVLTQKLEELRAQVRRIENAQ